MHSTSSTSTGSAECATKGAAIVAAMPSEICLRRMLPPRLWKSILARIIHDTAMP
jgi:hypothetical protein